jgi:hypothetical protein
MLNKSLTEQIKLFIEETEQLVTSERMFICLDSDSNISRLEQYINFLKSVNCEKYSNLSIQMNKQTFQVKTFFNISELDSNKIRKLFNEIKNQLVKL